MRGVNFQADVGDFIVINGPSGSGRRLNEEHHVAFIVVTHDPIVTQYAQRTVKIRQAWRFLHHDDDHRGPTISDDTDRVAALVQRTLSEANLDLEVRTWEQLAEFYRQLRGFFEILFGFLMITVTADKATLRPLKTRLFALSGDPLNDVSYQEYGAFHAGPHPRCPRRSRH